MTLDELAEIERVYWEVRGVGAPLLMVGFNRRFAPQVQKMKGLLSTVREPKAFVMTVNAGTIPPEHWTQDPQVGGGRVIGEMCHFIDLLRFLVGTELVGEKGFGVPMVRDRSGDTVTITLRRRK